MQRDANFPLLLLCFFLSGFAGLVYETTWTREFAFVFGASNLAVATVLAAYMAGLAGGAAVAARFAPRIRRPLLAYGLLELGIGLAALAVPQAIAAARALYVALFGGASGLPEVGGLATALFYLGCSFAILLLPTAMMGATLPLLARQAVRRAADIGPRVGLLYAINTAGAVAGTLFAAFVLLPEFGVRLTIWIAAGINGLVFVSAWALARKAAPVSAPSPQAAHVASPRGVAWILPLILASGAVSFSYEILWVRLLEHVLGASVYAFATMLASFLAGIALGAAGASRLATTARRAGLGFALAQVGTAALSTAAFGAVDGIPEFTASLRAAGASRDLVAAAAAMATLFPAALCIGATFPFAVRVLARAEGNAGSVSARVYAANTCGAIVGAVGAGFFVVPELGFAGTLTLLVATNLVLAAAAAALLEPRRPLFALIACAALVLSLALPRATPWRILRYSPLTRQLTATDPVVYAGVGRTATVLLMASTGRWYLRTNGNSEGYIDPPSVWHNRSLLERWLGVLPVLARPEARSLLVVGLGGGTALEAIPHTVERIDVVEIEPEVVAANRAVGPGRWRDPLADPRVHVHINDARNALLLSESRFDAIVSQPSHPWSAGASHLYTREFFELVKSRLAPEGVFTQWIGFEFVDELLFRSLLATLGAVYENVRVYSPPARGGALFIASDGPLDVEASAAQAIAAAPDDFATLAIAVPEDVGMWLILDEAGVREMSRGGRISTDGHNLFQTRSPRILDAPLGRGVWALVAPLDPLIGATSWDPNPLYLVRHLPRDRADRLAETVEDPIDRRVARAWGAVRDGKLEQARALLEEALAEAPRHREARGLRLHIAAGELAQGLDPQSVVPAPLDATERAVVSAWQAPEPEAHALLRRLDSELAAIPPDHPLAEDAQQLRAGWRVASGDLQRAREAIDIADQRVWDRGRPGDLLLRAQACVVAGEPAAALEALYWLDLNLPRRPQSRATASRALAILQTLPPLQELADTRAQLDRSLRRRVR